MKVSYCYDPCCDWYIRSEFYEKDDQKYVRKQMMYYYHGKTNIPKVTRIKAT